MKRVLTALLACCLLFPLAAGCAKKGKAALPEPEKATIAVLVGTTGEAFAESNYPQAVRLPFDSLPDAVTALLAGKADYVLSAYTNCLSFARANPGKLVVLPEELTAEGIAIAVNKSEAALSGDISRVVEAYLADGTMERLIGNWIREDGSAYVREEIPVLADAPVLQVAVSAEREPMCYVENGEIVGLDAELIQRIAYELGMRVEFQDMKFSAIIPSVLSGKTPVAVSNITATDERREMVDFTPTYFSNPQVLMARAQAASAAATAPQTLDELAGKRIGVVTGSIFGDAALARWPDAKLVYYETSADMIIAMQQSKIDAFLLDQPVARQIKATTPGVTYLAESLAPDTYGFAFSKTDEGARLRDEFNAFMKTAEDGKLLETLDGIWFGADAEKKTVEPAGSLPAVNGIVRFASEMQVEPFNYLKNEQPVGFEIDLITRFCKEKGYGLDISACAFSAILPGLVSGRYDAAADCISITEERAQSVCFSDPVYAGGIVAVVPDMSAQASDADFFASLSDSFRKNFIVESRWKLIVSGIGVTLLLSVCSGLVGMLIGFGFCLMRMSRAKALNGTASAVIRVLQGTPVVVLLMILYYVVFNKAGLDGIAVAIIAFGLNFGAYASEIMLSGIRAVDGGQREASSALGFSPVQTFQKVIFPQAAQHFLPVLKGEYISLVKMTSIVGYVAVQDLTKMSDIIRSRTYEAFFPLIVTAVIYFLLSFGLSSLLKLVEIRIDPKRRPRTIKGVELQ